MNKPKELPKKVLIVDDDALIRELLEFYLTGTKHHFEFWEESNGQGGLALARHILPDLIVTDLNMPIMDGIQLVVEIRKDPNEKLRRVPIIVVTGTIDEYKAAAYDAGADVVLEKPLSVRLMQTALDKVLPK